VTTKPLPPAWGETALWLSCRLPDRFAASASHHRRFLAKARVGPTTCPLAATKGSAAEQETDRRLLQSIQNSSTLTNDRHPARRLLFTTGGKRAARAGYPTGIARTAAGRPTNAERSCTPTDQSPTQHDARRQCQLDDWIRYSRRIVMASVTLERDGRGPDSAKVRLGPAARTDELSNEPEYLLLRRTRPRNPGRAGAPSFGPGTDPRLLRL